MTGRSGSGPQASRPVLPETIAGTRYRVSRLLGEGGSKLVYVARDTALDRDVAIALFRVEGLDEAGRQRVTREARAMGRLGDNPNIVNVYDIGEEKGQPFIVSQYMPGGTLDDLLRRAPGGRLMAPEVIRLAEQVCGALEYAHSLGIIHRDVKPANVFLTADGQARLGDFGLAIAPDQSRLTMKGMMVGTAAYMPPEQVLGRPLEARSDLYSLGAMLYELLTGAPPFTGADLVAIVTQHVNAAPERPGVRAAGVPAALDELILRLLAKEPAARPTARQVRESLRAIAGAGHASIDQLASSVVVERPNLTAHAAPDGTVSILFSDIENSTKMTERLGDVAAQEMLHLHNRIIREQVAAQRGYEVKTMGDGFMIAFNSGRRALLCAIGVQRAFAENNARDPSKQLRVRIGLNTGEVIHEGGDFFGKAVILAARIGAAAEGAEILVSQTFRDITSGMSDLRYDSGRDLELKGLAGTYHVYRALWEDSTADVSPSDSGESTAPLKPALPTSGGVAAPATAGRELRRELGRELGRLRQDIGAGHRWRRFAIVLIVLAFAGPPIVKRYIDRLRQMALVQPEQAKPAAVAVPPASAIVPQTPPPPSIAEMPLLKPSTIALALSSADGNSIGPARDTFTPAEVSASPFLKWTATFPELPRGASTQPVVALIINSDQQTVAAGRPEILTANAGNLMAGVVPFPQQLSNALGDFALRLISKGHPLADRPFHIADDPLAAADRDLDVILHQINSGARPDEVARPTAETVAAIRAAAEKGDAANEYRLGKLAQYGFGVEKDTNAAAEWLRKSAEQGYGPGENNLGLLYFNGVGVPQDYPESMKWSRRAADKGNANAQFRVGVMYLRGLGVDQNPAEARKWLLRAADQNQPLAELSLGRMYFNGRVVRTDYVEARKWFEKSARQGNSEAARYLGQIYERGLGVPRNHHEASRWFNVANSAKEPPPLTTAEPPSESPE